MDTKIKLNNNSGILIVEDSPTQLEQLQHSLETHDYKVITAVNGKLGLEAARKHQPAIIISDIVMPEMNGYELCKAIRSDGILKNTPIVLLTSLSSPADVIEALKCGADNFIRKPYDEQHLLLRIDNILSNRKLRSSDKVQIGVELYLGGDKHFITAERQQILDLLISTYHTDIVILDIQLAEGQGFEVLDVIKKKSPKTIVIMFTNYAQSAFRKRSLEHGADFFIDKSNGYISIYDFVRWFARDRSTERVAL